MKTTELQHFAVTLVVAGAFVLSVPYGRLVGYGFFLIAYGIMIAINEFKS